MFQLILYELTKKTWVLCDNKEVAGIFSFYVLIYVFLDGLEQRFELRTRHFLWFVCKSLIL